MKTFVRTLPTITAFIAAAYLGIHHEVVVAQWLCIFGFFLAIMLVPKNSQD